MEFRSKVVSIVGLENLDALENSGFKVWPLELLKKRQDELRKRREEIYRLNEELSTLKGQLVDQHPAAHPKHHVQ